MISEALLMDNMEYMAKFPDKYFDLAVLDPPYGIGDFNTSKSRKIHKKIQWNNSIPDKRYFDEIYRVSKNQLILGANYFGNYIKSVGRIIHDKTYNTGEQLKELSDADIASHSFGVNIKIFRYGWRGNVQGSKINWKNDGIDGRIHPCQKPVALYDWIYAKYLPEGGKVLDTHLGSGSNRIAACKAGNIDFYSCENDPDHYNDQEKRWKNYKSQLVLQF